MARPVLADAWAPSAPGVQAVMQDTFTPAPSAPDVSVEVLQARELARFHSGRAMHRAGNGLFIGGATASLIGVVLIAASSEFGTVTDPQVVGFLLIGLGYPTATVGVGLSSAGAMQATTAVNRAFGYDLSVAAGGVGIAGMIGGVTVLPVIGLALGAVCGPIQMGIAKRGAAQGSAGVSWQVVPTQDGIGVAGRF